MRSYTLILTFLLCGPGHSLAGIVTNTGDSGPGSLRGEIAGAAPGDTITFDAALDGATITLTLPGTGLTVDKDLTIDAAALASGITIAASNSRVLIIDNATVEMTGITISNGREDDRAGIWILHTGTLTMTRCTVAGNVAEEGDGGGIFNSGTLSMNHCAVRGNRTADGDGGGISNSGTLVMNDCSIRDNSASCEGGGIDNDMGSATLNNCTVSYNEAAEGWGGGIFNGTGATLTMKSCTVARNEADEEDQASGIENRGSATLINCTVAMNAGSGGLASGEGDLTLENTIVGGRFVRPASGTFVLRGANFTEGDPMLAPINYYGGPTPTMPPMPGSPVIDSGIPTATTPASDQRGLQRIAGAGMDVGAHESGVPAGYLAWAAETLPPGGNLLFAADADGDGTSNGFAYGSGKRGQPKISLTSRGVEMSFGYRQEAELDLVWRVFRSTDLQNFEEILRIEDGVATTWPGITLLGAPPTYMLVDENALTDAAYYRLGVELLDMER